ncbi:hypothetical protein DL95DRAFT_385951 [Leptodontidium sp. 2 PMI_412]|nr:hypothetical protein DL95DRAFT_385951 [Leptodontidium sp. 2 PMI_412]
MRFTHSSLFAFLIILSMVVSGVVYPIYSYPTIRIQDREHASNPIPESQSRPISQTRPRELSRASHPGPDPAFTRNEGEKLKTQARLLIHTPAQKPFVERMNE